ncbi:hypothetical protein [Spongiactinospora sp. 9N601]|uniref:hypothetical protein n=1 Tax=Spongiactinospora sp. 9N601 TaxID=3375149 RepID=UPI0037A3F5A1
MIAFLARPLTPSPGRKTHMTITTTATAVLEDEVQQTADPAEIARLREVLDQAERLAAVIDAELAAARSGPLAALAAIVAELTDLGDRLAAR